MNNKSIFLLLFAAITSCSNQIPIKESNLVKETNLKQSINGMDFNTAVGLLADQHINNAMEKAKVVEVNSFTILYTRSDEIFIIKDKNVIARIIGNRDKTFYHSTLAPLSGQKVHLTDNSLVYNNQNNSFIDYGIDGIDVIEENHLDILDTEASSTSTKLPNTSFINNQPCSTLRNLSRTACCNMIGYIFTWEKGWEKQEKITEQCRQAQIGVKHTSRQPESK